MPSHDSPTRRVLGEKDKNASLNSTSPRKSLKTGIDSRSYATPQRRTRVLSDAIVAVSASPKTGQKRRIAEVEGVETQDWDERVKNSQTTDIISDSASETDQMDTSMMSARSKADTTLTSFGIGQSQGTPVEQHFQMLEPEMSQRTLEKVHAITLPQNTSQPSQFRRRPLFEEQPSLDSVGMSSFVNFHSDPSSQASDGMKMIDQGTRRLEDKNMLPNDGEAQEQELSEEGKRKLMMQEKAAQLRTRLQLAFFKVETRQTNTPFARLKVPNTHRRTSSSPPYLQPPRSVFSHHKFTPSVTISAATERTGLSPEARIAALRAQATMQSKPPVRSLESLPFPQIKPTAFSARWAEPAPSTYAHTHIHPAQTRPPTESSNDQSGEFPSSPPVSDRSLRIHEDDTATAPRSRVSSSTDADDSQNTLLPKMPGSVHSSNNQLSSPPPSQNGDDVATDTVVDTELNKDHGVLGEKRRRSPSNVTGEAASGLLQLMRSGGMSDADMRGSTNGSH